MHCALATAKFIGLYISDIEINPLISSAYFIILSNLHQSAGTYELSNIII